MIDMQIPERMKIILAARASGDHNIVRELGIDLLEAFPVSEEVPISDADLLTIPADLRENIFRQAVISLVNEAKRLAPPKEPPAALIAQEKELLRYANGNMLLLSLLYDLNLLPEVIMAHAEGKRFRNQDWAHMLLVIAHFKHQAEGQKIAQMIDDPEKQKLRAEIVALDAKIKQAEPYCLDDPDGSGRAQITQWEKELAEMKLKLLS